MAVTNERRSSGCPARGLHRQVVEVSWFSPAVQDLLARAHRELGAAAAASDSGERFRHAHLAALRAASAVVAVRDGRRARRRPQPVWDLMEAAAPELAAWAAYFRGGSATRAAVEAGRDPHIDAGQADHLMSMVGLFLDEIEGAGLARAS